MAELKLTDFDPMLTASTAIANETFNVSTEDITVVLEDQSGSIYLIEDVKYDPDNKSINIIFEA
jgi:hypothetical protein